MHQQDKLSYRPILTFWHPALQIKRKRERESAKLNVYAHTHVCNAIEIVHGMDGGNGRQERDRERLKENRVCCNGKYCPM